VGVLFLRKTRRLAGWDVVPNTVTSDYHATLGAFP